MSVLAILSLLTSYSFVVIGIYLLIIDHQKSFNRLAALIVFCFAFWSFTYIFMYNAASPEEALLWHRLGSIGWIGFCALAAQFYLLLDVKEKKIAGIKRYFLILLYLPPVIFILKSLLTHETPLAVTLVQSTIGWGWTFVPNYHSLWYWAFGLYLILYYASALYFTSQWVRHNKTNRFLKQEKWIVLIICIMGVIGFTTDFLLPAIFPLMPPLLNVFSIIVGLGYLIIVKTNKLVDINTAATPDIILETVMNPIVILDSNGIVRKCNQSTATLMKYPTDEIVGKPFCQFLLDKKYNQENIDLLINNKILRDVEFDMEDAEGKVINIVASYSLAETELDGYVGIVGSLHDVTQYKSMAKSLEKMAHYDNLTHLPNRRMFYSGLKTAVKNYRKLGHKFALIFIDLDGFKIVNDTYGHHIGDLVLVRVASMLGSVIRKQDVIARIGGDEFIVLFNNLQEEAEIDSIIQRMQSKFNKPLSVKNNICRIGMSFGISKCPEDGSSADELLRAADYRMYQCKPVKDTAN